MTLVRQRSAVTLDQRLDALAEAAALADGRLDPAVVATAREVTARAGVRRGLSVDHTVVALAGATGSGKSSLFNALAGAAVAKVGVTRPTTDRAQAALWDPAGAGPLLDWLEVSRRHVVAPGDADAAEQGPSGLILLDLPDHDSIEASHRLEVNRLVGLVDLLVWVLDPQKYADAAVHDRYLRPLARHRDVTVIVLNQIDRLPAHAVDACLADLRRLLDRDGLDGVRLVAASAVTGAGLPDLRWMLAASASRRRAWADRLAADAALAAAALDRESGPPTRAEPRERAGHAEWWELATAAREDRGERPRAGADGRRRTRWPLARRGSPGLAGLAAPLSAALAEAAGVPLVVEAVAKAHRHRAVLATGWPPTRWARRLRPDPLRRLHLLSADDSGPAGRYAAVSGGEPAGRLAGASGVGGPGVSGPGVGGSGVGGPARGGAPGGTEPGDGSRGGGAAGTGAVVDRTSLPAASAVQRGRLETAIRDVAQHAADGLPGPWAAAVRRAATAHLAELPDALDRAVAATWGQARPPRWWRAVGAWQWLLLAVTAAGLLWLLALVGIDYLRLPEPPLPTLGELPWPTVLFLGGILAGLLTALLARLAASAGARRRARRTERRLLASMDRVGRDLVLAPVAAELDRHRRFTRAVTTAKAA
jgi:GTPases